MSETVKVSVWIETKKVGSRCEDELEFDRNEWEAMTEEEREDSCKDAAFEQMEWGFQEVAE